VWWGTGVVGSIKKDLHIGKVIENQKNTEMFYLEIKSSTYALLNIKVIMRSAISPLKQKSLSSAYFDPLKSILTRNYG